MKPILITTPRTLAAALAVAASLGVQAQDTGRAVPIKYGNMDTWVTRHIKESGIIGGATKTLYEVGPAETIDDNEPYTNRGGSPWATSNVLARVSGVTKTNTSVYPERRGDGYCAKLVTHVESVKVLGLINISVIAAGSMYLGDMKEPITSTKGGEKYLNFGVPFTKRPKAVRFDYRIKVSGEPNRVRQTGFSRKSTVEGKDCCVALFLLQKRTEDADGNITAKRVGTMVVRYDKSTNGWVNGATYDIMYGDITSDARYNAESMGLRNCDYARNSKGESVPIVETGWASADEQPTHMVLQFASSHGGAFIGSPGNTMWVDNVALVY